ncbi:non-ribosomal peptide synthetase [Aminipila sp.]|uniref:non-ribosomal peptide synthetase n=1 Tax=Aminipila sp. TaxID=2060095 RepID=UPI00289CD6CE|nr:non-ribosomal peptide synthetase [Aminipila sp.]
MEINDRICEYKNLVEPLRNAMNNGNGITFINSSSDDLFLSYSQIYQRALSLLFYLQKEGIKPQDELIFQLDNQQDFIIAFWACIMGRFIPVPVVIGTNEEHLLKLIKIWKILNHPNLLINKEIAEALLAKKQETKELQDTLNKMMIKSIFIDSCTDDKKKGVLQESLHDDIAFIQFSSGSTDEPKGVVLTHGNLLSNIYGILKGAQVTNSDSALNWVPLTHDLGLIGLHMCPLAAGINQYLMETETYIRNPLIWFEKASQYKVSLLASPNFGYRHFINFYNNDMQKDWDLSCVRLIFNGAEPISTELSKEFYDVASKWKLKSSVSFPVYGLAEASLGVSFPPINEGLRSISIDRHTLSIGSAIREISSKADNSIKFVDLGYPITGCDVRICNEHNQIVGEKIVGYVHIKGNNVTNGYYNNKKATEEVKTIDGWLDTGDLGFFRDGRLIITGRAKDIIFINGQNYYPHDIEKIAQDAYGIDLGNIAVCGIFNEFTQREEVTAFVIHNGSLEDFVPISEGLKKQISRKTELEVNSIIPVKDIPKTTSGKLQRYKLKKEYEEGLYKEVIQKLDSMIQKRNGEKIVTEPSNEIEKKLIDIWTEVLNVKNIGVYDNFFECGGNSLKAAYIAAKTQKQLGVNVSLKRMFEITNIKELAVCLNREDKKPYEPIHKLGNKEYYKLSSQQKMIYIMSKLDENRTHYNIVQALKLNGKLNKEKLNNAFKSVIEMHEILRTYFEEINGEPVQKICEKVDFEIEYQKLQQGKHEINEIIDNFVKPFNLKKSPLLNTLLLEIEEDIHILVVNIHHIICDGSSVVLLMKDIFDIYNGKQKIRPAIQYKDYAEWQNSIGASEIIKKQESFWLKEFQEEEVPIIRLLQHRKRPLLQGFQGDRIYLKLHKDANNRLNKLAKQKGCSLYILLLTAYYVLMSKYTQQEDIVVGSPVSGRTHPDVEYVTGMFVNTLALRNYPEGGKSFSHFLAEVKDKVFTAFDNQDYPFERLVEKLQLKRDTSRNPLFDTMFVLQNMDISQIKENELIIEKYPYLSKISKFDLTLFAEETNNGILFEWEYCSNILDRDTVETMGQHYMTILEEILNNPEIKLSEISMMSEEQKKELIYDCNETQTEYPKDKTLQKLLEEQAERTPDNIALIYNDVKITYRQLNQRSNQLANYLRSQGFGREDIAGIVMDRSINFIITVFAVLKAGGAYLPIDMAYPKDRIKYILKDSGIIWLLVEHDQNTPLKYEGNVINVNNEELLRQDNSNLKCINHSGDLAYVIYTSGSTGKPKGTMLEHRSVINYIWWAAKNYVKNEILALPLYTTISFDLTVTSMYVPLITGNSIVIYDEDDKQLLIEKVFEENKVGVVKLTPAHLKVIKNRNNKDLGIKRLIVGGEQLDTQTAKEVYESFGGNIEIYNEYGPTEATVGCMIYQYDYTSDIELAVPIGVPADNVQIYLLDKNLHPVPVNTVGEMYISGDGVARGYLGKAELTAEKFISNPFIYGKRMYRTGDLAKHLTNGNVVFIGRNDDQVKVRGYRIETAEIEKRLLEHQEINQALVMAKEDDDGSKYLCGYYVSDKILKSEELRKFIIKELPEYMVPSYFIWLNHIPLTSNGKTDKKALQNSLENIIADREYTEPIDEVEKIMVSVWEEVLKIDKIGVTDNYFSLGGDSIKAIQIISKLNQKGMDINVKDILTYQTISGLCSQIKWCSNEKIYEQGILEGNVELIPIQRWFINRKFQNTNHYNQTVVLGLKEIMDIKKLNSAFDILIRHHDGLRLNYNSDKNNLFYNNMHLNKSFETAYYDISAFGSQEQYQEIERIGNTVKSCLDIYNGLLIRAVLIDRGAKSQLLIITAHHMIIDGVSWRILLEDFFNLIDDKPLPVKTASQKEWYDALIKFSNSRELTDQIEYWNSVQQTVFDLPRDIKTNNWTIDCIKKCKFYLDAEYTVKLVNEANRPYNTTIQELLVCALVKAIKVWTQNKIIKIELESHGRFLDEVNVSRTIGWFTSIYPFRLDLSEEGLEKQIKEVKQQLREIPVTGNGYPVLKYINGCFEDEEKIVPIRFNYLGDFDNVINSEKYFYYSGNTGNDFSRENNMTAQIDINSMIVNGVLEFEMNYNGLAYKEKTINSFQNLVWENLKELINYTAGIKEVHFTPSDFDTVQVDQDDLDSLFG